MQHTQPLKYSQKSHAIRYFQPDYVRDKFRIFLRSGSKNVEKNFLYNASRLHEHHVWVSFCVAFFRQVHGLSDIECGVAATYKAFHRWGKEPLTKIALAKQIGISTSTLHLAEKRLRDLEILIHDKNMVSTYHNTNRKAFRWVYRWNPFCESGLKKLKNQIESLKKQSFLKQQRTVPPGVKSQNSSNKNTRLVAPHIQLAGCWWEYGQHFHRLDDQNLKKTLYHVLKMGIRLPKLGDIEKFCAAIKKAATIPFLKQAHLIGWKEASKSRLVARGGEINDGSKAWGKYGHSRLNFIWLLKHWPDVLAGEYDERALSEKAMRKWEDLTQPPQGGGGHQTCPRRPETPQEELKQQIKSQTTCAEETALRERLLGKYGPYAYENWFQACGWCLESGNLTHSSDFHRNEIERKYGVRVNG